MSERKYSVDEIDRMRSSVRLMVTMGCRPSKVVWPKGGMLSGRSFGPGEVEKATEEMLRTYMLNGTDPEELE